MPFGACSLPDLRAVKMPWEPQPLWSMRGGMGSREWGWGGQQTPGGLCMAWCPAATTASSSLSLEPALFYRREVFLVLFQAPFAEAQLGSK